MLPHLWYGCLSMLAAASYGTGCGSIPHYTRYAHDLSQAALSFQVCLSPGDSWLYWALKWAVTSSAVHSECSSLTCRVHAFVQWCTQVWVRHRMHWATQTLNMQSSGQAGSTEYKTSLVHGGQVGRLPLIAFVWHNNLEAWVSLCWSPPLWSSSSWLVVASIHPPHSSPPAGVYAAD